MWIICDLDGTLSDHSARVSLAGTDINEYHSRCASDPPVEGIRVMLDSLMRRGHSIAFITARREKYRGVTNKWISDLLILALLRGELHMRPDDDERNDVQFKSDIYEEFFVAQRRRVLFVLEDRDRVVKMWREKGLLVLQPAEGNF